MLSIIASIAVIIVAIFLITALAYTVKILRTVERISTVVKKETDAMAEDYEEARSKIKREGFRIGLITRIIGSILARRRKRSRNSGQ